MDHAKSRAGRLAGKVALVTGAGQGLGQSIALAMAGEGASVVICDINADSLEAATRALFDPGRRSSIDFLRVRTENSDSGVLVMKPADQGLRNDATNPLNWARDRRIFVQ